MRLPTYTNQEIPMLSRNPRSKAIRLHVGRRIAYQRSVMEMEQAHLAQRLAEHTSEPFTRDMVASLEGGRKALTIELLCAVALVQDRDVSWYLADAPASLAEHIPGYLHPPMPGLAPAA